MRTQHRFLIIIFILLVSFPAIASDWEEIFSNKDFILYIDRQSIKGDATGMMFWEKTIYKKKHIEPVFGKYYIRTMTYVEIDCNNSIFKLHEVDFYSIDALVSSVSFSPTSIVRVIPDTLGETVAKYVCSFKPTK